ncbi:cytochrome P450 CYP749A22-like isoform X2 [Argentina anserina]|uniref:cytochrome P450 CYP749A22-like isoform X2 n=1 Tax=Argentina anserina TaxID=57926 RepID=UPI0021764A18|nr:cytochrome P450 CYP749A22-like isoform X2 [Potentilla anserina]
MTFYLLFNLIFTHGPSYMIFLQWYGTRPQLIVLKPELCKEILMNKDRAYSKQKFQGYVRMLLGDGLGSSEGEKWAKSRKVANHAFHGESLKLMVPEMIASAETMLKGWKSHEGKEIEVFELFRLFTSEVISRTAFGSSYLEGEKIFENIMKLSVFLVKNSFTVRFPGLSKFVKTTDEIQAEKIERGIRDSIIEIIKKRDKKAQMSTEEERYGNDFLGLLLRAHHDTNEKKRISLDDLVDECKTFYFAGQETTNSMLAWTVFLLAHYTDWQEKAREEVLQIFGRQTLDPDGLTKLKTMNMIMNESLRLYPPVLSIERKVNWDVKLGNFTIPANVEVQIPTLALHHEPLFWGQDVQLFKPERFSKGVAKATNNNVGAFLPFGMGSRICAGFNFAAIEAKIALSMILQRHSFTLSPGYVHSPHQYHTIRPQHGVQILLHPL